MGFDETLPIRLWVGNLGKYNEGELIGEWISFPCLDFDTEWDELMDAIGIDGRYYEEYFCADWECEIPGLKYSEYPDYERLNEIAEKWEELDSDEREIVGVLMREYDEDFDSAVDHVDNARIYRDCQTMADVAYQMVEELGGVSQLDPDTVEMYFNYEAFGRDVDYSGDRWDDERWNSFDNSTDAAYDYIDQIGGVSELSENVQSMYFDYKAFGRDLNYEGSFYDSSDGKDTIEILW